MLDKIIPAKIEYIRETLTPSPPSSTPVSTPSPSPTSLSPKVSQAPSMPMFSSAAIAGIVLGCVIAFLSLVYLVYQKISGSRSQKNPVKPSQTPPETIKPQKINKTQNLQGNDETGESLLILKPVEAIESEETIPSEKIVKSLDFLESKKTQKSEQSSTSVKTSARSFKIKKPLKFTKSKKLESEEIIKSEETPFLFIKGMKNLFEVIYWRNEPEFIEDLQEFYPGLENSETIDQMLREGNCVEVLKHLYSEKNPEIKLTFLKEKALEGHPLFQFEFALESFNQLPTDTTLLNTTLPWIGVGMHSLQIDRMCHSDPFFSECEKYLSDVYLCFLKNLCPSKDIHKYVEENIDTIFENSFKIFSEIYSGKQSFIKPTWLFKADPKAVLKNEISEDTWDTVKQKRITKTLWLMKIVNWLPDYAKLYLFRWIDFVVSGPPSPPSSLKEFLEKFAKPFRSQSSTT